MHRAIVLSLLALVGQAQATEVAATDELTDMLIDSLFDRTLMQRALGKLQDEDLHDEDLDATTLGKPGRAAATLPKPGHLAVPVQAKPPTLTGQLPKTGLPGQPGWHVLQPAIVQPSTHLTRALHPLLSSDPALRYKDVFEHTALNQPRHQTWATHKDWWLIDAKDKVVGRLATQIAILAMGKHKPWWAPNCNYGDKIVVINCDKIAMTGKKLDPNKGKTYFKHGVGLGNWKMTTAGRILQGKFPERVLKNAVRRMLPKNNLAKKHLMKNVHYYAGEEHPHNNKFKVPGTKTSATAGINPRVVADR
jgi:large subunit ribosomal protein L13